ncbi:MAG: hypothetical protein STSR0008_13130 [Ignavibacterium sp.]
MIFKKKILVFVLTFLFIISNSGLTFAIQYCSMMKEMENDDNSFYCETSENEDKNHSCCDENIENNEYFNLPNCMKLNEVSFSLKEKFLVKNFDFNEEYFCDVIVAKKIDIDIPNIFYHKKYFNNNSPPIKSYKYLLNSSLLI